MSSKRKFEAPEAKNFSSLECTDDEAREVFNAVLSWISGQSQSTQADRLNYLDQVVYHKLGFNDDNLRAFKKLRISRLPPFSAMKWDHLEDVYQLGPNFAQLATDDGYRVPQCFLPFSLHRRFKYDGWVRMDVHGDVEGQATEAGVVNIASYGFENVLGLFAGRVVNRAEATLPDNPFSRGGRVEFQLYTLGNTLVVLAEFKREKLTNDHAAQLFAEMISTAKKNMPNCQRVHGILSNIDSYYFYLFDPNKNLFTQGRLFTTLASTRVERVNYMVPVINHLFSVVLEGMKDFVESSKQFSETRTDQQPISSADSRKVAEAAGNSSLPIPPALSGGPPQARNSAPLWSKTFEYIREAQNVMQITNADAMEISEVEAKGTKGLELLQESMNFLPRVSYCSVEERGAGPKNFADLVKLIDAESIEQDRAWVTKWRHDLQPAM
ncbi:hypothetical protein B0H12DRAFT_1133935 [Mycena haematopus]|nr:hypothetical protein B0H12DRAFT_1133935 [Mycena haematopus]